jgi:alkylhydroperoxidase/carboxymuconolactone decarboxylase family protein YurZ
MARHGGSVPQTRRVDWRPFFELDPVWTDEFMAAGIGIYGSGVLPGKDVELLSIAFDASYTHMYAPGTRRHIRAALKLGATVEEIMEVLKLCVVQGVQSCNLRVPILAEELGDHWSNRNLDSIEEPPSNPGEAS